MSQQIELTIAAAKTATLVLGGLVTYFALKAYRRTGARPLRALAIGFGIITFGSLIAGVGNQFVGLSITESVLVQSLVSMVGFAVILYSLYIE